MNRGFSITRRVACGLAAAVLAACTTDDQARRAAQAPLEPAAPSAEMAAGDGVQFAPASAQSSEATASETPPASEATPAPTPAAEEPGTPPDVLVEVFPHIRINRARRLVEFDGEVPIDAHHPESPLVFLEVVACSRGTKEHEALVVTDAKPSQVHAALLLIGLEPGRPGSFKWENESLVPIAPTGDTVTVSIVHRNEDGLEVETDAAAWIRHAETGNTLGTGLDQPPGWVFAGSAFVKKAGREMYDADGAGTLIGLATFGSETVAFTQMISPEASVEEPVWVAASGAIPRFDTPVIVRLRAE